MIALEAYTGEGLLTGSVAVESRLADLLASASAIILGDAVLTPFDGPPQRFEGSSSVDIDDLSAVVAEADVVSPFHVVWHALALDLGPYRIRGELPAVPGFDPARALARPTSQFVLVGRVTVERRTEASAATRNEHAFMWINRYAVDAVTSDLALGFFFPGALQATA